MPRSGADWIRVCDSAALEEGGDGRRVELPPLRPGGAPRPAFVVRYDGQPRAWLNRCAHLPVELDWLPGKFFDDSGLYLICATHGAIYEPDSGRCAGGPCRGASLEAVPVVERDGGVWVAP
jgi:nitrite reductase/ring-hydroxylating ferredoxin subunit